MKQEIKPCPFCGEQPMVCEKTQSVYCKNALCPQIIANESDNLTDAIQGWNTRPDHIPAVTKKVDDQTLSDDAFDAEKRNMLDTIADLGEDVQKYKDLSERQAKIIHKMEAQVIQQSEKIALLEKRTYRHMYIDNHTHYCGNMDNAIKKINADKGTIVSITHPYNHRASIVYTVPDGDKSTN